MVFCVKDSQRFHLGSLCVFMEMSEGQCILLVLSRGMWKENGQTQGSLELCFL